MMYPKEMSKKDWIIFCCVVLVLAVAVVCVFPLPITRELTFYGAKVAGDGTVVEECDFTVRYTELNYLFREDCFSEVSLDVGGMHFDTSSYQDHLYPYTLQDSRYEWFQLNCYNAKNNAFGDVVQVCYDTDWDWCFVKAQILYQDGAHYFVGTVDESGDYEAVFDTCASFFD